MKYCSLLVEKQGYTCEEHLVTTQDGYVLSMQRIPVGLSNSSSPENRPPVLLQHGLFVDGATWALLPPNQSLAFVLADSGFDVWIANTRGTKYSLQHSSLSPKSSDYWNWSWDELAEYDLSATIKYVNNHTGQKMHYVGHSQGSLIALAAFSKHDLADSLRSASLLSPIAYLSHITSIARFFAESSFAESSPPFYDMSRIPNDIPLFFSNGGADALSDVEDVKHWLQTFNIMIKISLL
ncbi:triacylglycerol lipase 2-like [Prosopis cineraria]|uniref:triacylglycerol lipase 2-like n=1 Tax=Prosopis cineraria TaxID=364024 RepID=UPI0024109C56|nr:triacylglycerol lipase 2-like [Prosopis cineraria]